MKKNIELSAKIDKMARELVGEFAPSGWRRFEWMKSKRTIGLAKGSERWGKIYLSLPIVEAMETSPESIEEIRDVILHEIAHALTHGDHHGERWKRECERLGCRPEVYVNHKTSPNLYRAATSLMPYIATCPICGTTVGRCRPPKNRVSCGICGDAFDESKLMIYEKAKK